MVSARVASVAKTSAQPAKHAASAQARLVHSIHEPGEAINIPAVEMGKAMAGMSFDQSWRGRMPAPVHRPRAQKRTPSRVQGSTAHLEGPSHVLLDRPAEIPLEFTRDWASVEGSAKYQRAMRTRISKHLHDPDVYAAGRGAVAMNQAIDRLELKIDRHNDAVSYFNKNPSRLKKDTIFWRGVSQGNDPNMGFRTDRSFVPVSTDPAVAAQFAHTNGPTPVVMRILVKKGTPVMPVGRVHHEVLLPPGRIERTGSPRTSVLRVEKARWGTGMGLVSNDVEAGWRPPHFVQGEAGYMMGSVTPARFLPRRTLPLLIPEHSIPLHVPLSDAEQTQWKWNTDFAARLAANKARAKRVQRKKDMAADTVMQTRVRRRPARASVKAKSLRKTRAKPAPRFQKGR